MNMTKTRTLPGAALLLTLAAALLGLALILCPAAQAAAGDISEYEIDGFDYYVEWGDEWGEGKAFFYCEYCTQGFGRVIANDTVIDAGGYFGISSASCILPQPNASYHLAFYVKANEAARNRNLRVMITRQEKDANGNYLAIPSGAYSSTDVKLQYSDDEYPQNDKCNHSRIRNRPPR